MTARATTPTSDERLRLIKLIHVGKRELRMEDETYRAILREQCNGKTSSADLSVKQLERVVAHLKSAGFKVRVKNNDGAQRQGGSRALADDDQSRMIRAIWLDLHGMGIVRDPSEAALAHFVMRHTKVAALQWITAKQASSMIEHLKKWRDRILTERTRALWAALGLASSPSVEALADYSRAMEDAAERALGVRCDAIHQSQERFDLIIATARRTT